MNTSNESELLLGYYIYTGMPSQIPITNNRDACKKPIIINTINPHSYCVAKRDKHFSDALLQGDYLIPDGVGVVYASKLFGGKIQSRITGFDIFESTITRLNKQVDPKCMFVGSTEFVLSNIKNKLKHSYPNITVSTLSPEFKSDFSDSDATEIAEIINNKKPDIVYLGLTAPKQEKLSALLANKISANAIISIGAVFDFYADTVPRPSRFWQNTGFEWLPRLLQQPRRLWRRTFISAPVFCYDCIIEKVKR